MSRMILIVVAIIVVLGVALAATGVLQFRNTSNESSITLDKKELREKAHEAVEQTKETGGQILDKTGEALHNAAEGLRGSAPDRNTPTTTPAAGDKNTQQSDRDRDLPMNEKDESRQ